MWQYNYSDEYLCHWGIKGMKWGVRRFQNEDGTLTAAGKQRYKDYKADTKVRKTLTRHVSADVKNLKSRGEAMNDVVRNYNEASRELQKAQSKIFVSGKKRAELVDAAEAKVSETGKAMEKRQADYNRALRVYEKDAKALNDHVNKMISSYGKDNVKELSTKHVKLGEYFSADIIKTGPTIANIPGFGRWYTGVYTSGEEYKDRNETISKEADRRY